VTRIPKAAPQLSQSGTEIVSALRRSVESIRGFARFASTGLVLSVVAWCFLTVLGLGSELDPGWATARAAIFTSGLLLWGLLIVGAGYAAWAVVSASREALTEDHPPADPAPDERDTAVRPMATDMTHERGDDTGGL
jgi:hypothetical protein